MTKERIETMLAQIELINQTASNKSIEYAQGMLDLFNWIWDTDYIFCNKRVVSYSDQSNKFSSINDIRSTLEYQLKYDF